ncbi:carbon starvation CstA family protein [Candidatus Steffania adelgidicola]|uniref:carbon starvation CstA family protein n=1 Tax=Candidatus Steffania adelgidicola TaxID=1076626 RepID=UPI003B9689B5
MWIGKVLHEISPTENMEFWYFFLKILFKALSILRELDVGTRTGRFILQALLGILLPQRYKINS